MKVPPVILELPSNYTAWIKFAKDIDYKEITHFEGSLFSPESEVCGRIDGYIFSFSDLMAADATCCDGFNFANFLDSYKPSIPGLKSTYNHFEENKLALIKHVQVFKEHRGQLLGMTTVNKLIRHLHSDPMNVDATFWMPSPFDESGDPLPHLSKKLANGYKRHILGCLDIPKTKREYQYVPNLKNSEKSGLKKSVNGGKKLSMKTSSLSILPLLTTLLITVPSHADDQVSPEVVHNAQAALKSAESQKEIKALRDALAKAQTALNDLTLSIAKQSSPTAAADIATLQSQGPSTEEKRSVARAESDTLKANPALKAEIDSIQNQLNKAREKQEQEVFNAHPELEGALKKTRPWFKPAATNAPSTNAATNNAAVDNSSPAGGKGGF